MWGQLQHRADVATAANPGEIHSQEECKVRGDRLG